MAHHVPNGIKGIGKTIYNPIKHSQNCIWLIFAKQAWGTNFPYKISMHTFFKLQSILVNWVDSKKAKCGTLERLAAQIFHQNCIKYLHSNFLLTLEEMCTAEKCKYCDSCHFPATTTTEESNFSGNYGFDAGYFWQYHNKGPSIVKWL